MDDDSLESKLQAGFRYGLALTHDLHEAEDLVQQASYRLSAKYGEIRNRAILYRTMRNLFLDQQRRKTIVQFEPLGDEPTFQAPPQAMPDDVMDVLLAHLNPREREALFLQAVEGYTAQEIAEATETPRGSVLSLIHRAKEKLRRLMASDSIRRGVL